MATYRKRMEMSLRLRARADSLIHREDASSVGTSSEKLLHREARPRIVETGCYLHERQEDETPLREAGMRQGELGGILNFPSEQEQVEIERARPIGDPPLAPMDRLDRLAKPQELEGGSGETHCRDRVYVPCLRGTATRLGMIELRSAEDSDGPFLELIERFLDPLLGAIEVRPETDDAVDRTHPVGL
jgi:hypothetical protein